MNEKVHVHWHEHSVTPEQRAERFGHRGAVVWFTGLSGSGKSTVANLVDHRLHEAGVHSFVLDGDNVRHGLNASPETLRRDHDEAFATRFGLGFSAMDREENIRRIGAVAELFAAAGVVVLAAFVSPYRRDREAIRAKLPPGAFIEVFVDTPLEVCEQRDPKGLYKKARAGELKNFTGIDDPYEPPSQPELALAGGAASVESLADQVLEFLRSADVLAQNKR